jgi:hypothetical protein
MAGGQNFSRGIAQLNGSVGVDVQLSFSRSSAVTSLRRVVLVFLLLFI